MHLVDGTQPILELEGITKTYGRVVACDDVSLSVVPKEIRGLLGQNGAGKSTLMKVVSGVVRPDRGNVRVDGHELTLGEPGAAREAGIGMVHQHLSLVARMTVWENVVLGDHGPVHPTEARERIEQIGSRYGVPVDPRALVEDLSPAERQRVEIIKCLIKDPRVIILDEPTSVLTDQESRVLFGVLRGLVDETGCGVVLISHRLEEILRATDRVTILRDGRAVATIETRAATVRSLANEMLGREATLDREGAAIGLTSTAARSHSASSAATISPSSTAGPAPALALREISATGADGRVLLRSLTLHVQPGEILGVAGVEGNGQEALVETLSGLVVPDAGEIEVDGRPVSLGRRGSLAGIGVIPSDRRESGSILGMSVAENLMVNQLESVARWGVIRTRLMRDRARQLIRQFSITAPHFDAPMWSLSGGNQQRVVLARELSRDPRVLVAVQPTQGLDVGAMEDMWERLRLAVAGGAAVLLISTELDEILALADRINVIYRGSIVGEMRADEVDPEQLGLMMGGHAA
jgi:simple sugar transport system ATP-binding protein